MPEAQPDLPDVHGGPLLLTQKASHEDRSLVAHLPLSVELTDQHDTRRLHLIRPFLMVTVTQDITVKYSSMSITHHTWCRPCRIL
jgi:hypothetical protein